MDQRSWVSVVAQQRRDDSFQAVAKSSGSGSAHSRSDICPQPILHNNNSSDGGKNGGGVRSPLVGGSLAGGGGGRVVRTTSKSVRITTPSRSHHTTPTGATTGGDGSSGTAGNSCTILVGEPNKTLVVQGTPVVVVLEPEATFDRQESLTGSGGVPGTAGQSISITSANSSLWSVHPAGPLSSSSFPPPPIHVPPPPSRGTPTTPGGGGQSPFHLISHLQLPGSNGSGGVAFPNSAASSLSHYANQDPSLMLDLDTLLLSTTTMTVGALASSSDNNLYSPYSSHSATSNPEASSSVLSNGCHHPSVVVPPLVGSPFPMPMVGKGDEGGGGGEREKVGVASSSSPVAPMVAFDPTE